MKEGIRERHTRHGDCKDRPRGCMLLCVSCAFVDVELFVVDGVVSVGIWNMRLSVEMGSGWRNDEPKDEGNSRVVTGLD